MLFVTWDDFLNKALCLLWTWKKEHILQFHWTPWNVNPFIFPSVRSSDQGNTLEELDLENAFGKTICSLWNTNVTGCIRTVCQKQHNTKLLCYYIWKLKINRSWNTFLFTLPLSHTYYFTSSYLPPVSWRAFLSQTPCPSTQRWSADPQDGSPCSWTSPLFLPACKVRDKNTKH